MLVCCRETPAVYTYVFVPMVSLFGVLSLRGREDNFWSCSTFAVNLVIVSFYALNSYEIDNTLSAR